MKPERTAEEEEVARTYAEALSREHHAVWFWRAFNEAIIEHWSITALKRIKRRAWQLARASR